jgi:type I restriction enzyme, S subunit
MTKSEWREVALGQICAFKYGKSLPTSEREPGTVGVYGSNGLVGTHSSAVTNGPTIVVGRKGSFGEVAYSEGSCWPIDTTYYVDSSSTNANLRWLYYRLGRLGLKELNRAAAVPGLNREDAYQRRLLLPPAGEQQRIAEILDEAGALLAKRRRTIALLDNLAKSIFLEMFRDAADGCRIVTVGDLAAHRKNSIRTGPFGSQLLHGEFVESGIPVLGIDNAVNNEFRWAKRRFITEEKYKKLSRYQVFPGDVIITIMGTCGRCAVVPEDIGVAINTKHLCCISLDQSKCLPEFLRSYFLMHPIARSYLQQTAKGAIMSGLNMNIIKAMPVALPPLAQQERYVVVVREVQDQKLYQIRHLLELEELFDSLQASAFRGDL